MACVLVRGLPQQAFTNQTILPASADWRALLPPVKNQGQCSSSYAFAAVVPLEAALRNRGYNVVLSEQEIVDCSVRFGNEGCNGGSMHTAYQYIQSVGGLSQEARYPYRGALRPCSRPSATERIPVVQYVEVKSQAQMISALSTVGPVAIALHTSCRSFQMYVGGVYYDPDCIGEPDHAAALVGYGNENGQDYYLLRNSWGTSWGLGGYMKISTRTPQIHDLGGYPVINM
ncbi:peptidase C1A [Hesseltinella vesiculosa]|uniref:Peptidase C1A n=1 Tax=Hesseltinella vesiculosa TaxID=101127 RepID=A0A1X2GBV0_9FUNG|nr:peptidase C1A [Hesseltinella vesiculosa]